MIVSIFLFIHWFYICMFRVIEKFGVIFSVVTRVKRKIGENIHVLSHYLVRCIKYISSFATVKILKFHSLCKKLFIWCLSLIAVIIGWFRNLWIALNISTFTARLLKSSLNLWVNSLPSGTIHPSNKKKEDFTIYKNFLLVKQLVFRFKK